MFDTREISKFCDENSCVHRRGCLRHIDNFVNPDVIYLNKEEFLVNPIERCIKSEPYPYFLLQRFRYSHTECRILRYYKYS